MPGARSTNFRFGDSAELLAGFILNSLAFTTHVPRQEDVGHDLICALAEQDGILLRAGPTFTVQIKSNRDPISYEKEYEVEWLRKQDNPFFVCVAHRRTLSIDLYSTWNIHNSYLYKQAKHIVLVPGEENDEYIAPHPAESKEKQTVPLGKPILQISANEIMEKEKVLFFRRILREWIELERRNLVNIQARMHWIQGPLKYQTNHPLSKAEEIQTAFYYNAKNLPDCLLNFGRTATDLAITMHRYFGGEMGKIPTILEKAEMLKQVLLLFSEHLEPTAKKALNAELGIQFDDEVTS